MFAGTFFGCECWHGYSRLVWFSGLRQIPPFMNLWSVFLLHLIVMGFFSQAYSPMPPPHGYVASSPQPHPYMWGVQVKLLTYIAFYCDVYIDVQSAGKLQIT